MNVEHVTLPDTEFWTCGDVVLQDGPLDYLLSVHGTHRLYLNSRTLNQLAELLWARDNPGTASAAGTLTESEETS